jgi:predicted transcriptional regulator
MIGIRCLPTITSHVRIIVNLGDRQSCRSRRAAHTSTVDSANKSSALKSTSGEELKNLNNEILAESTKFHRIQDKFSTLKSRFGEFNSRITPDAENPFACVIPIIDSRIARNSATQNFNSSVNFQSFKAQCLVG